ncbi:MAG: divalent-cation tolerance protein CutA [Gemmatimonadota bacterium]
MRPIAVFTTIGNLEQARGLARALVERGLAACAQLSQIESFYVWDGALQQDPEVRIVLKTTDDLYDEVEKALRELHPYELPAIHAVALDRVHEPYAQWVIEGTAAGRQGAAAAV